MLVRPIASTAIELGRLAGLVPREVRGSEQRAEPPCDLGIATGTDGLLQDTDHELIPRLAARARRGPPWCSSW
jgi:hypothetical protein